MTKKSTPNQAPKTEAAGLKTDQKGATVSIVALGASAGGLEAFEEFFSAMPADSGMAFVLVAHLDPAHVSLLPELVQKHTAMPVRQICDGTRAQPNCVYVIPPNKNLTICNGTLQLLDLPEPRGLNLPIDRFFRALAQDQGAHAVGIILSGTGTDGTLGLKAIKGELGMVMAQGEETAKYDGMPRSAIATGLVDYVMPPKQMPEQLMKYTRHAAKADTLVIPPTSGKVANALQKIYTLLRTQTDHDFSLYKKNTICRRIERRMRVHQIADIADYVNYLQGSEREVDILFKELLIGVTNFFRDPKGFDALRDTYLPKLLAGKPDGYTLRVWVAGCSSGEEAYSLAIILQECMERMHRHFNVQIFGTDIDEAAVTQARAAAYPESIQDDVSPERLKRYFLKEDSGRYRIKTAIREMLVFATQNVIKDPPFTKLDLLSCRNLLIYLGPELQKQVLPKFHYSLRPDGLLFLGQSESLGQAAPLFSVLDKKQKIFQRQASSVAHNPLLSLSAFSSPVEPEPPPTPESIQKTEELSAMQLVETILHQSNMPPCVIIDDACNVVYIHGRVGRFIEPAEGKMSANILEMVRPALKVALTAAIHKVAQHKQEVVQRGLHMGSGAHRLSLDLVVKPILEQTAIRGLMMVIFQEATKASSEAEAATGAIKKQSRTAEELEQDLEHTQENLQTTIEELETANEELKSTNEELQSTNEELQSTNEEMETSKEELQALNEETSTVNAELQSRIDDLSKTNDDIKNLLDSTGIAAVFLDVNLCVRRFTPRATDIIPLTSTDAGRPIDHFLTRLMDVDLAGYGQQVLKDLAVLEAEVQSKDDQIYVMKVRPYRTVNNVIDGVVITFEPITARKQAEEMVKQAEAFYQTTIHAAPDGFIALDAQGNIVDTNDVYCQLIGYSRAELLAMSIDDIGEEEKSVSMERLQKKEHDRFETRHRRKDGSSINVEVSSAYCDAGSRKIVIFIREIGEKNHEKKG